MADVKTTTEDISTHDLTESEWKMIKILRQIRFGKMTVFKLGGAIDRMEPAPTIKMTETPSLGYLDGVQ